MKSSTVFSFLRLVIPAFRRAASCAVAVILSAGIASAAGLTRFQNIELEPGWNAVYLEVDPLVSKPADFFAGVPVDVAACHTTPRQGAQFVQNPSAQLQRMYGWSVWYGPQRSDAFLTSLFAMYGGRSYLIHALTGVTLRVEGTVPLGGMKWAPDAFNLVGFTVDEAGGPTFEEFFRGSPAHNHNRIYRLVNGMWRQVLDPTAAAMRSGEAFWIYCDGPSDYPGPFEVAAPSVIGLVLSSASGGEIVLRNRAPYPLDVTLDHLVDPAAPVPVAMVIQGYDEEARGLRDVSMSLGDGAWTHPLPGFAAGGAIRLPLEARLQDMEPGTRYSIIKVSTDIGTVQYLPVTATRDDSL